MVFRSAWLVGLCCGLACLAGVVFAQTDAKDLLAHARQVAGAGRHAEAIPLYERLVAAVEEQLGAESWTLVFLLHELASQHHALGQVAEAGPIYERAVLIGERHPEEKNVSIAPSLRGLAVLAAGRGELEGAEALYERALAVLEARDGESDPDVARTLAELALLSQLRGGVEEAEALYRRALDAAATGSLPEPELATLVNNLGALAAGQGRLAEAEPLYRRALEIRERVFGPDHPGVAFVVQELASVAYRRGDLAAAAPLYERSLKIREASQEDDLALSDLLNQLAVIHRQLGHTGEAETYFQRAVAVAEKNLGPEHPTVALRVNNLAVLYSDLGRFDEAEALYERTLEIARKAFGDGHVSVGVGLMNLASLHEKQGRRRDALAEAARARSILDEQCGGGEVSDFCRSAEEVHRNLATRLAAGTNAAAGSSPPAAHIATAPASTASARASRIYRAQVASRHDQEAAQRALARLVREHAALLADLPVRVARADLGERGTWYRIQIGEYADGAAAQALCNALSQQGHDGCFVIATAAGGS